MEKSKVIELLKNETVDLEFVKKDGSIRLMTCTLREDKLPKQIDLEESINKKSNDSSLAVFDLVNQGWRSFIWANLKSVNGVPYTV